MSSLRKQLNQLKSTQPSLEIGQSEKIQAPSLLFSHKVSQGIDVDTVYSLAISAFQNLVQVDQRFGKYQDTVLGTQNKRIDRTLLTESENDELSKKIKSIMCLLSLYFLNEDCLKVYDYLLRNFRVHIFEKEECIIYNLHYSSTVYFNRLLQNINLKGHKHFGFLQRFSEKDQVLFRSTLVKQISYDSYVLIQLIKYNEKISKLKQSTDIILGGVQQKALKNHPQTFLLAVLTEILGIKKNNENFLSTYTEAIAKFITKPQKIDQLAFSLSLIVALVVKERQKISPQIIQNFIDFLIPQLNKVNEDTNSPLLPRQNCVAILKTVIFLSQRNFIQKEISIENLQELSQFILKKENEKLVKKIVESYSCLPLVLSCYKTAIQQENSSEYLEFLGKMFTIILQTDHSYQYSQQIRQGFSQELFQYYFKENNEEYLKLLKQYFQADLIKFLSQKIQQKDQQYDEFIKENYPSLLDLYEKNQQFFDFDSQDVDEVQSKHTLKSLLSGLQKDEVLGKDFGDYFKNLLLGMFQISNKKQVIRLVLQCLQNLPCAFQNQNSFAQILSEIIRFSLSVNQECLDDVVEEINNFVIKQQDQQLDENTLNLVLKLYLVFQGRKISQNLEIYEKIILQGQNLVEFLQVQQQEVQLLYRIYSNLEENSNDYYMIQGLVQILAIVFEKNNGLVEKNISIIDKLFAQVSEFFNNNQQELKLDYSSCLKNLVSKIIPLLKEQKINIQNILLNFILKIDSLDTIQDLKENLFEKQEIDQNIDILVQNIIFNYSNNLNSEQQQQESENLKLILILQAILKKKIPQEYLIYLVQFVLGLVKQGSTNEKKGLFSILEVVKKQIKNYQKISQVQSLINKSEQLQKCDFQAWCQILDVLLKNKIQFQVKGNLDNQQFGQILNKQQQYGNYLEKVINDLGSSVLFQGLDNSQKYLQKFQENFLSVCTEIIVTSEKIQDGFKREFLEKLRTQQFVQVDQYYRIYISMQDQDSQFIQLYLGSIIENFKFNFQCVKFMDAQNYQRLSAENRKNLVQFLEENLAKFKYNELLNQVSDYELTQEIVQILVDRVGQLYSQKERSLQQNKNLNFILELFLYQGDKNTMDSSYLFKLLQDSQELNSYQSYLLLKLLKIQVKLHMKRSDFRKQQGKNQTEILGEFSQEKKQFLNLQILERVLGEQDVQDPVQYDIMKTVVEILQFYSQLNFKNTSNIVYNFLKNTKDSIFAQQQKEVNQEEQQLQQENLELQQQQEELRYEIVNNLFIFCVGEILKNNPEKQEKCVKFMYLHLEVFFGLLQRYNNEKRDQSIKQRAELVIQQILDLYGMINLHVLYLCSMSNIQKIQQQIQNHIDNSKINQKLNDKESQIQRILDMFLRVLLQNFFKPGKSIEFAQALQKTQVFVGQVLFQYSGKKNIQGEQSVDQQKYYLLCKTLGLTGNYQNMQNIMKNIQLLFKSIFHNEVFLKLLEQVILHKDGQEFLQELSGFYQSVLKYEVKLKLCLTNSDDLAQSAGHDASQYKKFLKDQLQNCKKQSEYISSILPLDYFLEICFHGLTKQRLENSIKQHILEKIQQKLENTQIKKRYHDKILQILQALLDQLKNNSEVFLDAKKRISQNYLQQIVLFFVQISQKKSGLIKELNTEELIDSLMQYFNGLQCFVMKNSILLLLASVSSLNKYKILENLGVLMKELLVQFLAVLKYGLKSQKINENFKKMVTNVMLSNNFKLFENEEKIFSEIERPNILKNKANLLQNNQAIFGMLVSSLLSFIQSLQNLMSPYLLTYSHLLLNFSVLKGFDSGLENFYEKLVESLSSRVLIEKTLGLVEISQEIGVFGVKLCAYYLKNLFHKLEADDIEEFSNIIYKKYVKFLDYNRVNMVNKEQYNEIQADITEKYQIEAFSAFILKTNEVQLRKMFLNLVTWSEKKFSQDQCGYMFVYYRKIILNKIILCLSDQLGQLFVPFFAFTFDNMVTGLQELKNSFYIQEQEDSDSEQEQEGENSQNRKRNLEEVKDENLVILEQKLLQLYVDSFKELFLHDKEQFLDQQKYEQLTESLLDIYECVRVKNYVNFTEQHMIPCVVQLFDGIQDDYKWKNINYNLMLRCRTENNQIKMAILKTLDMLIDRLGDRFIVLINDVLPFLSETVDDTNSEVEAFSKQIVTKLEHLSGENIQEYFKSQR